MQFLYLTNSLLRALSLTFFTFFYFSAQAQEFKLSGRVKASEDEPLAYIALSLSPQSSSDTRSYTVFTGEFGEYNFEEIPAGNYVLNAHPAGYEPVQLEISLSADLLLADIIINPLASRIETVEVTANPPVLERRSDRFLMHVSNSSFQTGHVMDIFQSLPFMQVRGEELLIHGRRNIMLLVDHMQVPAISMMEVLNSMTAAEIDRIDFITTPGARYDAGVDAVIHIHTKKGLMQGWTGSVTGNVSQGVYNRSNAGGNATYRKGKWGIRGSYNFTHNDVLMDFGGYQQIDLADRRQVITTDFTELYRVRAHNMKVDLSYELTAGHQLGAGAGWISATAPGSSYTGKREFKSAIQSMTDSILMREQRVYLRRNYQNYSLNYQGRLDTLGRSVEFIATYTPVDLLQQSEMLFQDIRHPNGALLNSLPIIKNDNPTHAHIWIVQNDWELPFKNSWKVEGGAKYSGTRNNMLAQQLLWQHDTWQPIPAFTFHNRFYEDIFAGYLAAQKTVNRTMIRASLRLENTIMGVEGVYHRQFLDLFPHIMLQQEIGQRQLTLNYRRSIARPSFNQLAPWRIYLDEYAAVEGNMLLQPTYTDQILINGSLIKNLLLELEYNNRRNQVVQLPEQEELQTIFRYGNIHGSEWAANINYSYKITSWWSGMLHARGFRWSFDGVINEADVSDHDFAYNFGVTATAKLPADTRLDLTYNYDSPYGLDGARFMRLNMARAALTKSFLQQRLTFTLAVADIFMGQRLRSEQQAGNLFTYHTRYTDVRRVSLGGVFQFGKKTVKAMAPIKLGNEDVINRAGQ